MKIIFNNFEFILNNDGSIFWVDENILILGDLHLEKGTSFAEAGNFLPPYDSLETLMKLTKTLNSLKINKIIFLGDIFHDQKGYSRLDKKEKKIFDEICDSFSIIWIYGNHDYKYAPKNIKALNAYKLKGINFSHIPTACDLIEISGHYHPKVSFLYLGKKITKPCFVISKRKVILPAYGSFTGGLNVSSQIYKKLLRCDFDIYALE